MSIIKINEVTKKYVTKEKDVLAVDNVNLTIEKGEIFGITLPAKVALKITECAPGTKGNTVTSATKDATVETGLKLRVPLFIEEGEIISVRTDNGAYDGRAKEE